MEDLKITAVFYIIAIIISIAAVYYLNTMYNQPQPHFFVLYSDNNSAGFGMLYNNLSYPIVVSDFYCTSPNGEKYEFASGNANALAPGQNESISLNSGTNILPENCTGWKVSYDQIG